MHAVRGRLLIVALAVVVAYKAKDDKAAPRGGAAATPAPGSIVVSFR
jgi:hypothetical protein